MKKKIHAKKLFCHNGGIVLKLPSLNNFWRLTLQTSARGSIPSRLTSTREGQDLWRLGQPYQYKPQKNKQFFFFWSSNNLHGGWQEHGRLMAGPCLYFIKTSSDLTHSYEILLFPHTGIFQLKCFITGSHPILF